MPEHDHWEALDQLVADVVRARAHAREPVPLPDPAVLADLRARGAARRRRRLRAASGTVLVAAIAAVAGTLALVGGDDDPGGDIDVVGTTTTVSSPPSPGSPAIGAEAEAYVGLEIRQDDFDVWTADGRPLTYLTVTGAGPARPGTTGMVVSDGDATMLWLLAGSWPDSPTVGDPGVGDAGAGTVVDAVDIEGVAVGGTLGTDCSAAAGDPVIAVVQPSSDPAAADPVVAAWRITAADTFRPVPPTDVTCSNPTSTVVS